MEGYTFRFENKDNLERFIEFIDQNNIRYRMIDSQYINISYDDINEKMLTKALEFKRSLPI